MNYFSNHCWCSDSNWGGTYDCRHIVTIEFLLKGGEYHRKETHNPEWYSLINHTQVLREDLRLVRHRMLKPEVLEWLNTNVKDREDETHPKGWCIGTQEYIDKDIMGFNIFFHRLTDARAFAKKWAKHGTFDSYFNYFREIRMEYCPKKKRMVKVKRKVG